jgi:hypothetical protein
VSAPALAPAPEPLVETLPGALPLGGLFGAFTALGCAAVSFLGLDHLGVSLCFFKLTTGLPCPTCGATRVFGRLAHLDVLGALAMNPLAALGALALLLWGLADLVLLPARRATRLRLPGPWHNPVRVLVVALVVVNWAYLLVAQR